MTTAAKKAAATKADQSPAAPAKKTAAKPLTERHALIAIAEEQRTANLIAVLGLGEAAWSDLYAAGVDEQFVTGLVVERLGIGSAV